MLHPPSTQRLRHWPAGLLALVAAGIALWAQHRIFPHLSWNRDEPVYLWQLDVLRSGHLTGGDGGHPELFHPWLSAHGDGVFFTQYTLGWPLVLLAAEVVTGSSSAALGLGAALAVLGTYAFAWEISTDRSISIGAATVIVASPILPIQGGVYLGYLFTLGLGLLFGVALLSGIRERRTGRLLGAGALLGWIFLTRPYDAVLWGLAFGAYAVVVHRHRWRGLVRPVLTCGAGTLPFVAVTLAYNRHVTGSLLEFPITAADPLDTFGFGGRRLIPGFDEIDYTPWLALRALAKHGFFLPWFLAGSYLGLVVAVGGLWSARRERSTLALLLIGAVFPLGYFLFWGSQLSSLATRVSGPIYYVPLYPCIAVLIATAVARLWERHVVAGVVLVAAMVLITIPLAHNRLSLNHELSSQQEPWRTSTASIDGRALVFVADSASYLLYLNPFSSNGPRLDDRVLYAADGDPTMLDLLAEHPDRTPYVQQASAAQEGLGPKEHPVPYDVTLVPVEVRRGRAFTVDIDVGDPGDTTLIAIELRVGPRVLRRSVSPGDPLPTLSVAPPGVQAADLQLPARGTLSITVGYGRTETEALRRPAARQEVQFRVVDGTVEVFLPTTKLQSEVVGDTWQWRRRLTLADLEVRLTPTTLAP